MISLAKLLLEEDDYSQSGTEFTSAGESFCIRGAKTKQLSKEQEQVLRDIMLSDPTPEQEDRVKQIIIASNTGKICKDAGDLANRYKQHGITRDDLVSAGLEGILRLTWPRIDWEAGNPIGIFVSGEAYNYMRNYANKEVQKKGLSGMGSEEEVGSMMKLDAPISGKDGDSMTAYDIIGGSFDNEFEEADFMERLYRFLKRKIPQGRKSTEAQKAALGTFMGVENGEYTGRAMNAKQASETGEINATKQSIYGWYGEWTERLKKLKQDRPELFNEEKNRMKKIAGIK